MKKIIVSDFTLKTVEEQSIPLTFREKIALAEKLDAINVDAIELPAIINSKENEVIYRTIAKSVTNAMVKISVGNDEKSLATVFDCVKDVKKLCLQVIMPVSTAQMEYFHHLKAPNMESKIVELVKLAHEKCDAVEFVAKDVFRAEEGFVENLAKKVFDAGAYAITLCDDAGEALPEDYQNLVAKIKAVCDIKVYIAPSNVLSMGAYSTVMAINAGADGVKTSIIGDYIAPAVISDIFSAKKFDLNAECGIDATKVKTLSLDIDQVVENYDLEEKERVVSGNIDAGASMKDVASIIKQLGYELSDADVGKVFEEIKKLTTKKELIDVKEIEAVIASTAMQVPSTYHLVNYVVNSGNIIPATANVTLEKDGEKFTGVSTGDGPIDAAFHAIEQVIGHHYELDDFQVHAVTKGRGAVGSSIIRLRADGKLYPGNGVSTDIVGACIRAYINALNKIVYEEN